MPPQESELSGVVARIVPDALRSRFARKFLVGTVLVMLVTAGLGGVLYQGATATLDAQVDEQVGATAQLQAEQLENWIEGLERQTRLRAEAPVYQTGSTEEIRLALAGTDLREEVVAVHYVDTLSGTVEASTDEGTVGTNLTRADVPWARDSFDRVSSVTDVGSRVYVADRPYRSPADETRVMAFVTAPSRNTQHVLVVEAAVDERVSNFHQTSQDAYTSIHGPESTVYDGGTGTSVPQEISSGSTNLTTAGGEVVGAAPVAGTNWTVLTHVPSGSAFSVRDQVAGAMVALVVVPLLGLGGVALVIGRRTGRSLQRLTTKAEAIEDGDLDVDLERRRADEIGRLTAALDSMREALETRIREARDARKKAEVARQEAVETSQALRETADDYSAVLAAGADGDLTVRMDDREVQNEAMEQIAADFNGMMDSLEQTLGQLDRFASEVEESAEAVDASACTARDAAEEVVESVQATGVDAHEQRKQVQALLDETDDLTATLEQSAAGDDDPVAEEALQYVEEIRAELRNLADALDAATAKSETTAEVVEEQVAKLNEVREQANYLRRYSQPLGQVLDSFETEADREFFFPAGPTPDRPDGDAEPTEGSFDRPN